MSEQQSEQPIDREEIARQWLAEQQEIENAEDERVYKALVALAAQRGREIIAIVQCLPDGSAAIPAWGVRKKRG
jgi:hypothetical protein